VAAAPPPVRRIFATVPLLRDWRRVRTLPWASV